MSKLDSSRQSAEINFSRSKALFERASHVIPGGVWGHNKFPAIYNPGKYPWFARSGKGAYFTDADGNQYIDYMCGYGAMISGYAHAEIDSAAKAAMDSGECLVQATELSIELAEKLSKTVQGMDWCAFGKNGSDALAIAILCARAATGRASLICVGSAYHGSHFWCNWSNPGEGRPLSDSIDVHRVDWNDPVQMEKTLQSHRGNIAAVILTPFHHPIPGPSVLPSPGYWKHVERLCREHGAMLVIDDVRTGLRLDLAGSHRHFGFQPDLVCMSKAIGNTHPISVTLGRAGLLKHASAIFAAGTFWGCSVPMAAALTNLRILHETNAVQHMDMVGQRLAEGLVGAGSSYGYEVNISGVNAIPTMTISGDQDFEYMQQFAETMVSQGSFINPMHNWFLSAAHTVEDIDTTLEHSNTAFATLKELKGRP